MNTGKAILAGLSLIASAIVINHALAAPQSGNSKYILASSDGVAYRLNSETGEISLCIKGMTMEESLGCTPWTR